MRYFLAARRAADPPDAQPHEPAAIVRQLDALAVQRGHLKIGSLRTPLQQPILGLGQPPLLPALGRLPCEHRVGDVAVDGHRRPLFIRDDIVADPGDSFQFPGKMISPGQRKIPASLVLHNANFDLVAFLVSNLFRSQTPHTIHVLLKTIGVTVERAGLKDGEAHPSQKTHLVPNRVATRRGRLFHIGIQARLLVDRVGVQRTISRGESGPPVRPVNPQRVTVADEDSAGLFLLVSLLVGKSAFRLRESNSASSATSDRCTHLSPFPAHSG